ncbi:MAG: FecR domain-containing protein [Bacteriovoracaceae bacterium]|nr:FecR domain-containing protein [Bacteriovoracaceae bacterium]
MNKKFTTLFLILLTCNSYAAEKIGKLLYKKGEVTLVRKGVERSMIKGEPLYEGDLIETGKKSLAIISFLSTSKMKLDSKSSIELEKVMGSATSKNGAYVSFYQKAGTSLIKFLNKSKKNDLEVRTKNVSIGVRGTKFLVGYGRGKSSGDVYTYVNNGNITAMNFDRDDHIDVPGGQGIYIGPKGKMTAPREFPWAKKLNWDTSASNTKSTGFYNKKVRLDRQKFKPTVMRNLDRRPPNSLKNNKNLRKWNNFRKIRKAGEAINKREGRNFQRRKKVSRKDNKIRKDFPGKGINNKQRLKGKRGNRRDMRNPRLRRTPPMGQPGFPPSPGAGTGSFPPPPPPGGSSGGPPPPPPGSGNSPPPPPPP